MKAIEKQQKFALEALRELYIKQNNTEDRPAIRELRIRNLNNVAEIVYAAARMTYYPHYTQSNDKPSKGYPCAGCIFLTDGLCTRDVAFSKIPSERYDEKCYTQPDGEHGETMVWAKNQLTKLLK